MVFNQRGKNEDLKSKPLCYVGVAASEYAEPFDIKALCNGAFDEAFKKNKLFFQLTCEVFFAKAEAIKKTNGRSVTKNSAYVLEINCAPEQLTNLLAEGKNFSDLVLEVTNAKTAEKCDVDIKQKYVSVKSALSPARST